MTIDAHAHIFPRCEGMNNALPLNSFSYGKMRNGDELVQMMPPAFSRSSSDVETLLAYMDWQGVERSVLVPNAIYGYHNGFVYETVKKLPDRFSAIALVDITKGEAAVPELRQRAEEGFMGIKIEMRSTFQCCAQKSLIQSGLDPVWEACDELGSIIMIHPTEPGHLRQIGILSERYQNVRFVICHMGAEVAIGAKASPSDWKYLLDLTAFRGNMWIETSSIANYCNEQLFFDNTISLLREAYRAVGHKKILWGSDYPCMLMFATYRQMIDLIRVGCSEISQEHQQSILYGNALELFWAAKV